MDLDPVSGSTFHAEGFIYYFSRRYDQALAVIRRGLRINLPDWNFLTGDIYAEKGMYAESIGEFIKSGGGPYSLGHLGNVYARAGKADAALKTISQLQQSVRKDGVGRYEIALVYTGLGKKNEAFTWLDLKRTGHRNSVYINAHTATSGILGRTGTSNNEVNNERYIRKMGTQHRYCVGLCGSRTYGGVP